LINFFGGSRKAMSIALLYERSENDENGIKLTAQQLGIDLTFLPFRKISLSISKDGFSAKTKGKAKIVASKPHTSWNNLAKKH
jgi:hypothetical protein